MIQFLGWLATILFTIALVPQIHKTISLKKIDGVSLLLFLINLTANIIALIYAILIFQYPLIIKYVLGILITALYIGVYAYYRRRQSS